MQMFGKMRWFGRVTLVSSFGLAGVVCGGEVSFSEHIQPIFNKNCVGCHGGVKMAEGVSFIYRDLALGKGESGKRVIVPGDAMASEAFVRMISDDPDVVMPPPAHGHKLDEAEIKLMRDWINQGAKWEVHWAFEKPVMPEVPKTESEWGVGTLDRLALATMEENGLKPAGEASAAVLLRRLKFDVVGLPPTIAELDVFEKAYAADAEKAWAEAVDRYLGDDAFGERWASVWQDLARYSDSEGLGLDRRRLAYPYRDWLIRAFNEDMPFDEFTVKQLAGDLLGEPSLDDLIATNFNRQTQSNEEGGTDDEEFRVAAVMDRVATTWEVWQGQTFACVQCHSHPYDTFEHDEYYQFAAFFNDTEDGDLSEHYPVVRVPDDHGKYVETKKLLDEKVAAESRFYGGARKVIEGEAWKFLDDVEVKVNKGAAEVVDGVIRTKGNVASGTHFDIDLSANGVGLGKVAGVMLEMSPPSGAKAKASPDWGAVVSFAELRVVGSGVVKKIPFGDVIPKYDSVGYSPEESLKAKGANGWGAYSKIFQDRAAYFVTREMVELADGERLILHLEFNKSILSGTPQVAKLMRVAVSGSDVVSDWAKSAEAVDARRAMASARSAYGRVKGVNLPVMAERDVHLKREMRLFERGNWMEKGKVVEAGTPNAFPAMDLKEGEKATRLDMAKWLVSGNNPLTARVAVNRFWHQFFGRGIVETLEDFGSSGVKPTDQRLLDYLALRFQGELKWGTKAMMREILMSKVYRLSAEGTQVNREKDPQNLYFSYGTRRRLPAEAIRDSGLAVSGLMTEQLYGYPTFPPLSQGVWKPFASDSWKTPKVGEPQRYRRAIYTYWKRSIPYPSLSAFDAPSREVCSKRRLVSNSPIAALTTLNNAAFAEFAQGLARRMKYETKGGVEEKVAFGYRIATSTRPSEAVLEKLVKAFRDIEAEYTKNPKMMEGMAGTADGAAYTVMASLLLNLDAALTQ